MSIPQKPRESEAPLAKLKKLWPSLSESAQDYWLEQFTSERKQSEIRQEIFAKLKIKLSSDAKLTNFRKWLDQQAKRDEEAQRQEEDLQQIKEQYGDWTLDQIREEVLKRSYARALATGDFKSGRQTIVQDLNVKKVSLDERKLVLLEKKAAQFDKAKEVIESKLSPEEQRQRLKEILK
jgi:hypothetical protein